VLILAIDTSSPAGSVAVVRDEEILGVVYTSTSEIYSSRMFRHLEFLLNELALKLDAFDLFAVAAGPGSFTGLRVGLAAVKGWAEAYHKPIAAVSTLEAVAAQVRSNLPVVVPVLNAHRGEFYFGRYRRQIEHGSRALEGDEYVATPEELCRALPTNERFSVVTPSPELLSPALSRCETQDSPGIKLIVEEASAILAPWVGRLGLLQAKSGELTDPLSLDANYVRRSDAELKWNAPSGS